MGDRAMLNRAVAICLAAFICLAAAQTLGDRVQLADGRILEGRFTPLQGVVVDPLEAVPQGGGGGGPILMCDDDLARTMVAKRRVRKV